jgi:hypothetical protein
MCEDIDVDLRQSDRMGPSELTAGQAGGGEGEGVFG